MNKASDRFPLLSAICCIVICVPLVVHSQEGEGEKLFKQVCVACHTIGAGKLIGPDLAGVHERRPEDWIISFVKSSQAVVKSGDAYAVALFEKFNRIPMPDNDFTDEQVLHIVAYIAANSPGGTSGGAVPVEAIQPWPQRPVTDEDTRSGRALFAGQRRLENGGAACISCHNLDRSDLTAGGALARDLTDAFARLGGTGIEALIRNSPFPVMNRAFVDRPLTDGEVFALVAFLQFVSTDTAAAPGPRYALQLFLSGLAGAFVLVGIFAGLWFRGKRVTVNQAIYERQVKSR